MSATLTLVLGVVALVIVLAVTYKYAKKWKTQKSSGKDSNVEDNSNKKI